MIDDKVIVAVKNRDNGNVGYTVPDLQIRRQFTPGEVKRVTAEELRKLSYASGGKYILTHCLIIDNKQLVDQLLGRVEPEYYYTEKQVKELLLNGTLEQLEDCLDFAPKGVIDTVKSLAVSLEINDLAKRTAISEKTGLNVTKAIEINHETEQAPVVKKATTRRAAPVEDSNAQAQETPKRRAEAPKYQIKLDE